MIKIEWEINVIDILDQIKKCRHTVREKKKFYAENGTEAVF